MVSPQMVSIAYVIKKFTTAILQCQWSIFTNINMIMGKKKNNKEKGHNRTLPPNLMCHL